MTTATIQKWGNSQGIRIPKHILDAAALKTDEQVSIDVSNGMIIIKKAAEKKTIRDLFEGFDGEYSEKEVDFGEPRGEEVW